MAKESENNKDLMGLVKAEEYLQFIEFMALPTFLKKEVFGFATGGAFADKYNLSIDTLTDWKKKEGFWDRVKKARTKWVQEKVSEVLAALYRKAIEDGSASEVKLFLQYAGEFEETLRVEGVPIGNDLTEEEKESVRKAIDYAQGVKRENNIEPKDEKVVGK